MVKGKAERRLNVSLDRKHATALGRLAKHVGTDEETLAQSLLSRAIDDADVDRPAIVELLDGIPGALQRARLGRNQGRRAETIPLEDF